MLVEAGTAPVVRELVSRMFSRPPPPPPPQLAEGFCGLKGGFKRELDEESMVCQKPFFSRVYKNKKDRNSEEL